MAITLIDLTTPQPGGKFGDPTKTAWEKANDNFTVLAGVSEDVDSLFGNSGADSVRFQLPGTPAFTRDLGARAGDVLHLKDAFLEGDTPAQTLDRAILYAVQNNKVLNITEDTSFADGVELTLAEGQNLSIVADPGVTVSFSGSGKSWLKVVNSARTSYAVSSITSLDYDLSGGAGVTTRVSSIVAPGNDFRKGDLIKVFSDDLLPKQHNDRERKAEWAVVGDVVGSTIVTTSPLVENYTSGIRVVRPGRSLVTIAGFGFVYSGSDPAAPASGITLEGFAGATIDLPRVRGVQGPAIQTIGCAFGDFRAGWVDNLANSPTQVGYGFNESGGFANRYRDTTGVYTRHVVTTNTESTNAGDNNYNRRGRSIGMNAANCYGVGNAGTFDTHSDALDYAFVNCVSRNAYRGVDASGCGFQLRGPRGTIVNCESQGDHVGAIVYDYSSETDHQNRAIIRGFVHNGRLPFRLQAIDDVDRQGGANSGIPIKRVNVMLSGVYSRTATTCITAKSANVSLDNCRFNLTSDAPNYSRMLDLENSAVSGNATYDLRESVGANNSLAVLRDSGCFVDIDANVLESPSVSLGSLCEMAGFIATLDFRVRKSNVQSTYPGFLQSGAGSALRKMVVAAGTNTAAARSIDSAAATLALDLDYASDPVVFRRIRVQSASGLTLTTLGKPTKQCQLLVVTNRETSVGTLTIGTSGNPFTQPIVCGPGEGVSFVAYNDLWYRAS